ncbi:MAG: DUF2277 family protein [Chloroflexota bacterium]|nr:DUF2277 family protein [Chloroflexota bacterium]
MTRTLRPSPRCLASSFLDVETLAAAPRFVRKISGCRKSSKVNEAAFSTAVDDIARISTRLLAALESPQRVNKRLA